MTTSQPEQSAENLARDSAIGAVLTFVVFGYALSQTLMFPALSTIQRDLHAGPADGAWIVSGFLVSGAILTPVLGALGDARGPRRILLVVLVLATLGGLIATAAPDMPILVAGRIVQGASLGILPLAFSIVRQRISLQRQHSVSSVLAGIGGAGAGVGLVVGGVLTDWLSWRALFGLGALLSALGLLAVLMLVPRDSSDPNASSSPRFDVAGALVLACGLVTILLGMTQGASWGWGSPGVWALIGVGLALLLLLGPIERRAQAPLVDISELSNSGLVATHLTALLIGAISFPFYLLLPLWAQTPVHFLGQNGPGFGGSVTLAGLILLPGALTLFLGSTLTTPLAHRWGPLTPLVFGFGIIFLATFALLLWRTEIWQQLCLYALVGFGTGFIFASQPRLIASHVPVSRTGAANGLNNIARSIGSVITTQAIGGVVASTLRGGHITDLTFVIGLSLAGVLALAGLLITPLTTRPSAAGVLTTPDSGA